MESENRNDDNEGNNCDEDGFIGAPDIFRIWAEGGMRVGALPRVSCNAITLFTGEYR
jgi:hypothetical protein